MSPVLAFLAFISCIVAGAHCFNLFEVQCPKNAVGNCMAKVQKRTSDIEFCREASAALDCVTRVLHVCFAKNDPALLDALSDYDIAGLFQKMTTVCN